MGAKYGQHFLTNQHAAQRIVDALNLSSADQVLEIGPGKGVLTDLLFKKCKVIAVEVDPQMIALLEKKNYAPGSVQIINQDILDLDFKIIDNQLNSDSFKIIGNLPYNITSPILRRLCDWKNWTEAVIMVQKEVGDRICAKVGDKEYGALSVGMALSCRSEKVFDLSESSFNPPPKVKSSVIKLFRLKTPLTDDIPACQKVVQAAFQQRRKTIYNSLSHGLQMNKEAIGKMLALLNISPTLRAQNLSPEQFIALTKLKNS
ncbi:MAG: 16S rRNA (adenine(1518)-N(6)/adenine(1519)-N(6))-dimethyltransferase RsmA [Elusimicrobiota bacterium]